MDALGTSKKQNLKNKGEIQIPFAELSAKAVRDQIFNNACSLLSSQAKSLVLQTARAIRKVLPITADYPSNPIAFSRSDPFFNNASLWGKASPAFCLPRSLGTPLATKAGGLHFSQHTSLPVLQQKGRLPFTTPLHFVGKLYLCPTRYLAGKAPRFHRSKV